MTKNERIQQLERFVSDLSRRVYDLEKRTGYVYYPRTFSWQPTYTGGIQYYASNGETRNFATDTTTPRTGSISTQEQTEAS